jgi:hypothetical protein
VKLKRYRILKLPETWHSGLSIGQVVYEFTRHDFGGARDDTRILGEPCRSVTIHSDGDYPFLTLPESYMQEIEE